MSADTTGLLQTLKKITQPLFNPAGVQRLKILRSCFPHPKQEGLDTLVEDDAPVHSSRKHIDPQLEKVNTCMRILYHEPFTSAQKGRILNGESAAEALYHLKAQALYAKLYAAEICHLTFFSNPGTPDYAEFPQCWLKWEHDGRDYFLDPVNYDCAIVL